MWPLVIFFSILYTEFIGYVVHRMLHAEWIPKLSLLHLDHHKLYPPKGKQVTEKYLYKQRGTWIEQVGLEWILPISAVTIPLFLLLCLFGVPLQFLFAGVMVSLVWTWVGFAYMHEAWHVKNFWMRGNYIFDGWYRETKKLHVIHHNDMTKNYGITLFMFDKLFETFTRILKKK